MARRSVDGLGHARRRTIAPAIVWRAQMRPAFHYFARDLNLRHVGIVTLVALSASRVEGRATGLRNVLVLLIPVCGPLPYVAGHLVEPVAVGWKASHRRSPLETVFFEILPGKLTLPGICHLFAVRREGIAPDEFPSVQSAASGELPLGFGGQLFADPFGVGFSVLVGDVHHRVFRFSLQRACRSLRMAPISAGNLDPQL